MQRSRRHAIVATLCLSAGFWAVPIARSQVGLGIGIYNFGPGSNSVAVTAITLAGDGILAAGASQSNPGAFPKIAELQVLPNGPPDATFGMGGFLIGSTAPSNADFINGLFADVLGRRVEGGASFDPVTASYQAYLGRRDPSGALDPSFGTGGQRLFQIDFNRITIINSIRSRPDGSIYYAGVTSPDLNPGNYQNVIGRVRQDGSDDPTCNGTGYVTDNLGNGDVGLVIDPVTGAAFVTSKTQSGSIVVQGFNPDCTPNTAFGLNGVVMTDFGGTPSQPNGITLGSDGSLYVAGTFGSSPSSMPAVLALDSSGSNLWLWRGPWGIFPGTANAGVLLPDGNLLVGGEAVNGPESYSALTRLNAVDGSTDLTFGTNGFALTNLGSGYRNASYWIGLTSQTPDYRLVSVGVAYRPPPDNNGRFLIQVFNHDGDPVPDFWNDSW